MTFAENILKLRASLGGISQSKLAKLLFTSQSAVSNWEKGVTKCDAKIYLKLEKLCDKKGIIINWRK